MIFRHQTDTKRQLPLKEWKQMRKTSIAVHSYCLNNFQATQEEWRTKWTNNAPDFKKRDMLGKAKARIIHKVQYQRGKKYMDKREI